eukprot:SAG11_NODE_114_length_16040_cov_10.050875_25_plen_36_part_01
MHPSHLSSQQGGCCVLTAWLWVTVIDSKIDLSREAL